MRQLKNLKKTAGNTNIKEFKQVNKGCFKPLSEEDLEVDNFIYQFDSAGRLINVTKK